MRVRSVRSEVGPILEPDDAVRYGCRVRGGFAGSRRGIITDWRLSKLGSLPGSAPTRTSPPTSPSIPVQSCRSAVWTSTVLGPGPGRSSKGSREGRRGPWPGDRGLGETGPSPRRLILVGLRQLIHEALTTRRRSAATSTVSSATVFRDPAPSNISARVCIRIPSNRSPSCWIPPSPRPSGPRFRRESTCWE